MGALDRFGEAIRELRLRRDISSQSELAARSGVAVTTVNKIETGKRRPDFDTVGAILDALGFELYDLANALDTVNGRSPMPMPGTARPQWVALMTRLGINDDVLAGIAAGLADPSDATAANDLEASAREAAAQMVRDALELVADAGEKARTLMVAEETESYKASRNRRRRKKR